MINLLIADDEPLVQAGIKSMINWDDLDIHIIGTAANGALAYDMIKANSPDIVITDIKMPVMTGLELAQKCHEEQLQLPIFIILTSYEEFGYAKEAVSYGVSDYLVKLELTPEILRAALEKAIATVQNLRKTSQLSGSVPSSIDILKEQFYTRLISNLFEVDTQFESQAQNLKISFDYASFAAAYIEISSNKLQNMTSEQQLNLYTNSLQMTGELISKYLPCHVLSLDMKHFSIIFFLKNDDYTGYEGIISNALQQVSEMLFNYYSVELKASIGSFVPKPMQIAASFQDAKQVFSQTSDDAKVVFFHNVTDKSHLKNVFNISIFKEDIRKAYAEYNTEALQDIFTTIIDLFKEQPTHYVQALDAAGNILHLSLSLLNNGEQIVSSIFKDKPNGYRSLYELTNVGQIIEWLQILQNGLCAQFSTYHKDYKNKIVINVKKFIDEHVEEKLNLNMVAEIFNFSPNYLSVLFSKYNDIGFNDYINQQKIEAAKRMMTDENLKIYEISDALGFESAFYFSRVFKKVTGFSPRDYMKQNL